MYGWIVIDGGSKFEWPRTGSTPFRVPDASGRERTARPKVLERRRIANGKLPSVPHTP